mmetsp:Transcript_4224/g.15929  ORF Transcript_4224/g.15929 Transcript_4224/m.15929 type:complete len:96 (-) Transcript_4224:3116-3403(-)
MGINEKLQIDESPINLLVQQLFHMNLFTVSREVPPQGLFVTALFASVYFKNLQQSESTRTQNNRHRLSLDVDCSMQIGKTEGGCSDDKMNTASPV